MLYFQRNAPASHKVPSSTAPAQQGDSANIPSEKLIKADYFEYDLSEKSHGIRLKTEISENVDTDARSSQVRQLTQKQTQASSVQSAPLIKLPEGSVEPLSSSTAPFKDNQVCSTVSVTLLVDAKFCSFFVDFVECVTWN